MTETRKWSIGTAVIVVLLLVASWFLLIAPQRSEAADLNAQAGVVVADNEQLTVQIETLKAQQKQLPKWQAQLAAIQTALPASAALPGLIRDLSKAADKAGVELVSLAPASPTTLGDPNADPAAAVPATPGGTPVLVPGALAGIDLQLAVSGGYFEIQQFVNNLERLDRVFLDLGVAISEDTAAAVDGEDTTGLLTGTVTGRVFLVPPVDLTLTADPAAATTTTTTTATGTQPAAQ